MLWCAKLEIICVRMFAIREIVLGANAEFRYIKSHIIVHLSGVRCIDDNITFKRHLTDGWPKKNKYYLLIKII